MIFKRIEIYTIYSVRFWVSGRDQTRTSMLLNEESAEVYLNSETKNATKYVDIFKDVW